MIDTTAVCLSSKVSSLLLLDLNCFEKTLEVSSAETIVVVSLDYLEEKGRSVLNRLGEDLKEVTLVVVVDKDLELLDNINVFDDLDVNLCESLLEVLIVGVWDSKEFDSSGL